MIQAQLDNLQSKIAKSWIPANKHAGMTIAPSPLCSGVG